MSSRFWAPHDSHGVATCEKRHITAASGEPFRDITGHRLPSTVLTRRSSPGNWRKDRDAFSDGCEGAQHFSMCIPDRTSSRGTVAKLVA